MGGRKKSSAAASGAVERKRRLRRETIVEATCVGLVGVGLFFLLSILSHARTEDPEANICGRVGATVGGGLLDAAGLLSFSLPALCFVWAALLFLEKRIRSLLVKAGGALVLFLCLAALGSILEIPHGGGWIGAFLQELLEPRFSRTGSIVILATLVSSSLLLTTDWLLVGAIVRILGALQRKPGEMTQSDAFRTFATRARAFMSGLVQDDPGTAGAALETAGAAGRRPAAADPKPATPAAAKKPASQPDSAPPAGDAILPAGAPAKTKKAPKAASAAAEDAVAAPPGKPAAAPKKAEKPEKAPPPSDLEALPLAGAIDDDDGFDLPPVAAPKPAAPPEPTFAEKMAAKMAPPPEPKVRNSARRGAAKSPAAERPPGKDGYCFPPLDLLEEPTYPDLGEFQTEMKRTSRLLEKTLEEFKLDARVVEIERGPAITQYEMVIGAGIKVNKLASYADNLAMALSAKSIRIVAPIPGKSTIGVEVPNQVRETVWLKDLAATDAFARSQLAIPLMLGKDSSGAPLIEDLAAMPHVLIAGSTGSGKSVSINSIIMSILLARSPEDVRLILIDPKMVELSSFADIPHLLTPVVTDMKRAPSILEWAVEKMEERYEHLARVGVRNIASFNKLGQKEIHSRLGFDPKTNPEGCEEPITHLPYIVIIVDELADLMMVGSKEVEGSITRLAQKSRAVGIHVILATQRPSVDVITGLIKANMPCRVSFKVASKVDSRTILDQNGADKLLGQGDMLYLAPRTSNLLRAQGAFVADAEVKRVVDYLKSKHAPVFSAELLRKPGESGQDPSERDELYAQAVRIVLGSQRGSVSLLQRHLEIGYTRAARLVDMMAEEGLVGKYKGSQAREVLLTLEEWEARFPKDESSLDAATAAP